MKDYSNIGLNSKLRRGVAAQDSSFRTSVDDDVLQERTPWAPPTQVYKGNLTLTQGGTINVRDDTGGTVVFTFSPTTGNITRLGNDNMTGTTSLTGSGTVSGNWTVNGILSGSTIGAWTRVAGSIAGTVATVDFTTGINSTYDEYEFVLKNVLPITDNTTLRVQVSSDAGTTWQTGTNHYTFGRTTEFGGGGASSAGTSDSDAFEVGQNLSNVVTEPLFGEICLPNPSNGNIFKPIYSRMSFIAQDSNNVVNHTSAFYKGGTAAISGVRFIMGSGNIARGTFVMYGRALT